MPYGIPESIILITPTHAVAEALTQKITELSDIKLFGVWTLPLSTSQTIDPANTFIIFSGQPHTCMEIQQLSQQIPTLWLTEQAEELVHIRSALSLGFIGQIESTELGSLKTIIKQGALHFQIQHELRAEIRGIHARLAERKQIERAKGLLMQKNQCNESEAYAFLRKLSMDRAQRMGHVAKEFIYEAEEALK